MAALDPFRADNVPQQSSLSATALALANQTTRPAGFNDVEWNEYLKYRQTQPAGSASTPQAWLAQRNPAGDPTQQSWYRTPEQLAQEQAAMEAERLATAERQRNYELKTAADAEANRIAQEKFWADRAANPPALTQRNPALDQWRADLNSEDYETRMNASRMMPDANGNLRQVWTSSGSGGGGGGISGIAAGGGGGGSIGTVTTGGSGNAGSEVNQANRANELALNLAEKAAMRSEGLYKQAMPGIESLTTQFYNPAMQGNFQQTQLGRNMQLEIMRQMEKAKERTRRTSAMAGRSAQETASMLGDVDIAAAQSLAEVPLTGLKQAQGYFTGLAGLAQGLAPNNVNIQTPGVSLAGIETPLATRYANEYGYGSALADLPYYLQ